ncbi:MAG: hypothetical protein U5L09_08575 [Bacteroidales bacterium]|nr:hypothetical protein [Bacteroidales bacterium]
MKLAMSSIRLGKKRDYHKYYKCQRCGYVSDHRGTCPVCRREGHRARMKRS